MFDAAHVKPAALFPAYGLRGILQCETLEKNYLVYFRCTGIPSLWFSRNSELPPMVQYRSDLVQQVELIQNFLSTPSEDWSLSYGPVCGAAGKRYIQIHTGFFDFCQTLFSDHDALKVAAWPRTSHFYLDLVPAFDIFYIQSSAGSVKANH